MLALDAATIAPHAVVELGQMEIAQRRVGIALPRLQHHVADQPMQDS